MELLQSCTKPSKCNLPSSAHVWITYWNAENFTYIFNGYFCTTGRLVADWLYSQLLTLNSRTNHVYIDQFILHILVVYHLMRKWKEGDAEFNRVDGLESEISTIAFIFAIFESGERWRHQLLAWSIIDPPLQFKGNFVRVLYASRWEIWRRI